LRLGPAGARARPAVVGAAREAVHRLVAAPRPVIFDKIIKRVDD
jgi:hypothetical protein